MTFKVTIESARRGLSGECLNEECKSGNIEVVCEQGNSEAMTKEHYTCRECSAQWIANLFAAEIETIVSPEGTTYYSTGGPIERGAFSQIACPIGPIADALKEFLSAMKLNSAAKRGEALAKLAFMARVDL